MSSTAPKRGAVGVPGKFGAAWRVAARFNPLSGPVIIVWANASPRLMTMIPIVRALRAAGHDAILGFPPHLRQRATSLPDLEDIECLAIPRLVLRRVRNARMFVSAETSIAHGPRRTVRVALYHSLPDHDLTYNYAAMFRRKPHIVPHIDYFGVSVRQSDAQWDADRYRPIVDETMPAHLLRDRREHMIVFPFGYPKIDLLMQRREAGGLPAADTILYAPTQTTLDYGSVREYGAAILGAIHAAFPEYRIVFRPYPGRDAAKLRNLAEAFAGDGRFYYDTSVTGEDDMIRSAVMVTDRSSMAMSFSLGLARPSVFFDAGGIAAEDPAGFARFDPVGFRAGSPQGVVDAIRTALASRGEIAARIEERRGNHLYHPGHAASAFAGMVPDILAGTKRADWLTVPRRPFPSDDPGKVAAHIATLAKDIGSPDQPKGRLSLAMLKAGFAGSETGLTTEALLVLRKKLNPRRYLSRPKARDRR